MCAVLVGALALLCTQRAAATTAVDHSEYTLAVSEVYPGNLLPQFRFQLGVVEGGSSAVAIGGGTLEPNPFVPDDTCPAEIWDHASLDLRAPQLPHLSQDQWGCERETRGVPSLTVEDEHLRLSILPQWGGRIWSAFDKEFDRELVFANPAHQPANIAVLKAWTSGGIEYNWSPGVIGHSVFSESPAWVGTLETERGTVVRTWEFDRWNATVWQVDLLLGNGTIWLHPAITPTREATVQGYWWTCVAVPATPETRVLAPAEWTAQTSAGSTVKAPWPAFSMGDKNTTFRGHDGTRTTDNSWLGAVTEGDFFMGPLSRIAESEPRYIAWTELDGFVSVHGHPNNGTKLFTWGQNGAGRFMQDLLAGVSGVSSGRSTTEGDGSPPPPPPPQQRPRVGDYAELQTGPAFTQMQTFEVPAGAGAEWTEWFVQLSADPAVLRGDDYAAALGAVEAGRKRRVSNDAIGDLDAFFRGIRARPVERVLSAGQPWGGLEALRRAHEGRRRRDGTAAANVAPLAPGVVFNVTREDPEAGAWVELLEDGQFSDATLARSPTSYQLGEEWIAVLEASPPLTWLHELHLGVAKADRGETAAPLVHFNRSLSLRPSVVAARCLGVLQTEPGAALELLLRAWAIAVQDTAEPARERLLVNLAVEITNFLSGRAMFEPLGAFLDGLADLEADVPRLAALDAVLAARAAAAVRNGDPDAAIRILADPSERGCFPTYGHARAELMETWFAAVELRAGAVTPLERRNARVASPVPRNIGCPYGGGPGYPGCVYW